MGKQEEQTASAEQLNKALLDNFPDHEEHWPQNRRVWLMGRIVCDLRGNINPMYVLRYIDDYIKIRSSNE